MSERQFWKTLVKNASFIGKTLKNKISHIFLIHFENFTASINSLGFFDLSHAFWCEKIITGAVHWPNVADFGKR
jgi:hypothetical protein